MGNFRFLPRHKYKARRSKCLSGHYHPSKLERNYCELLNDLKKNGEIKDYECERRFELRVNDKLITTHKPDFLVTRNDGKQEIHETKGLEMADWKIKKKLFQALFPDLPYIVVK